MLSVARRNVPDATFLQMNMAEIDFPPESFNGLISCYAIFHVPRDKHASIFRSFRTILKPHGTMLVSVGSSEWEEVENYYGVKMFWSHFHPTTTESLITDAGFSIEFGRDVESGDETHYWILARK
jgi:ubiquinone/menaquinone biosynthesis C-methylase UbiE